MQPFLDALPEAEVCGIDFDPALLPLAEERLRLFGARARLIFADLRSADGIAQLPASVDAVISATALHWLTAADLASLYRQLASRLRPGGLFVNADHVASPQPEVQKLWEQNRVEMRRAEAKQDGEDWDGYWEAYARALGLAGRRRVTERVIGGWNGGVEEGLPLEWHFAELKASGFSRPECFWRCDCDAILAPSGDIPGHRTHFLSNMTKTIQKKTGPTAAPAQTIAPAAQPSAQGGQRYF